MVRGPEAATAEAGPVRVVCPACGATAEGLTQVARVFVPLVKPAGPFVQILRCRRCGFLCAPAEGDNR